MLGRWEEAKEIYLDNMQNQSYNSYYVPDDILSNQNAKLAKLSNEDRLSYNQQGYMRSLEALGRLLIYLFELLMKNN